MTPGRSRGTQTRSAPGRISHRTGVGIDTASPSMPTGIRGASAVISMFFVVSTLQPVGMPALEESDRLPGGVRLDSHHAEHTAIKPLAPARPAMSPLPYGLLATSTACGAVISTSSACATRRAPR